MENLNEIMSKRLKSERGASLMTQTEIANALGIDRKTLLKYEKNPVNVPIVKLARLCELYGCTVQALMKD